MPPPLEIPTNFPAEHLRPVPEKGHIVEHFFHQRRDMVVVNRTRKYHKIAFQHFGFQKMNFIILKTKFLAPDYTVVTSHTFFEAQFPEEHVFKFDFPGMIPRDQRFYFLNFIVCLTFMWASYYRKYFFSYNHPFF